MATFPALNAPNDRFAEARRAMVESQLRRRSIRDDRVLRAMGSVPRHEFVLPPYINKAYDDEPLPIGHGQTISQPYIVAAMLAAAALAGTERVLEIGAGCGYQAALVSLLAREVYTVEFLPDLARTAAGRLERLGYTNVHMRCGDGTLGWPEHAPYDAILIAAAAPRIPEPVLGQLAENGRLIAPVGDDFNQEIQIVRKAEGRLHVEHGVPCRFVPLVGKYGWVR
jgi:protein-L-isoaspartate(D-aspartate) O-methyltransferase